MHVRRRYRKAVATASVLAVTALAASGMTPASAQPSESPEVAITDLGPALHEVNVRNSAIGTLPDGTAVAYVVSNGNPSTFTVLDIATGARIDSVALDGYTLGTAVTVAPDGSVYFAAREPVNAGLWRYQPGNGELEHIGDGIAGERMIRTITVAADGMVYMGTYPNAKLVSYDPATGAIRDFGSMTDDADYLWGVGVIDDEVWVGSGPVPHLFRVDRTTGAKSEMAIPAEYLEGTDWIISIERRGDLVFIAFSPRGSFDRAVYDLSTDEWVDLVSLTGTPGPTTPDESDIAYLLAGSPKELIGYDLVQHAVVPTDFADSGIPDAIGGVTTYGIGLIELDLPAFPGESVVGVTVDGQLWRYNIETGSGDVIGSGTVGTAVDAHQIGVAGGDVFVSAHYGAGFLARIRAGTGVIEQIRGPKQGDAYADHGDQILISTYPDAVLHMGDPEQPWSWGQNPRMVNTLGRGDPYHQDRIYGLVSTGDRVAMGSVPNYGELGGALTLFDPQTGNVEFHRNVVADQSVVSLAYRDGLLYGSTSIYGGLSSTPTQSAAKLFIWDVAAQQLVWEGEPSGRAEVISGLTWTPDGRLLGGDSNGVVFEFDPVSRTVVRTVNVPGVTPWTGWGQRVSYAYDETNSGYLGTNGGALFYLDLETFAVTNHVADGINGVVRDGAGDFYAISANLLRLDVADESAPVTTATVSEGDKPGDQWVTLEATDAGSTVTATEYSLDGEHWSVYGPTPIVVGPSSEAQTVLFRSADSAGNVEQPRSVALSPVCDRTVTGTSAGPLHVQAGITCLAETVTGPVQVDPDAGIIGIDTTVGGPLSASGASVIRLSDTNVTGPLTVSGAAGTVYLEGLDVSGPVSLTANQARLVLAASNVRGPLSCIGNVVEPVDDGRANSVVGPSSGQCLGW